MRRNDDPPPVSDPQPTSNVPPAAVAASSPNIGTETTVSSSGEPAYMQCIQNQAIRLVGAFTVSREADVAIINKYY